MTQCVADEVVARFARRQHDWMERVLKGSLDPEQIASAVQALINRGGLQRYPLLTENWLLRPVVQATTVSGTGSIDLGQFFQAGPDLHVWDTFRDRFDLGMVQPTTRPYVSLVLQQSAYDRRIRRQLPKAHLSRLEDIAYFIGAQRGGQTGLLLTDGRRNVFYVLGRNGLVFPVLVYRKENSWCVGGWLLNEVAEWDAGTGILCPGMMS